MVREPVRPARRSQSEPRIAAVRREGQNDREWDPPTPPPARRAVQKGGAAWSGMLVLLAMAILIAGVATLAILELWLADRIMPGVYVWDVDVGGLSHGEAEEQLATSFRYPQDRYPILHYGDLVWTVDPAEFGTQLDAAATVDAAMAVGHTGNLFDRLGEQVSVLLDSRLVIPHFTFAPGAGTIYLSQIAQQVNRALRNSTLTLGDGLQVQVIPGQAGREANIEATRQALLLRIGELGGGEVALVVRESEPLLTNLSAVQTRVQHMLSAPVTLTAPDLEPWIIEPATLASWLILRPTTGDDGNVTLTVSLDPAHLTGLAQEIAQQVDRPAVDAQFRFDLESDNLVPIVESEPGLTLDVTATVSLIDEAARGDQRTVALPLTPVRPAIATEDAPSLGIVELIGEGITSFDGSSDSRVQNIIVGAAQFDGLLIPPGETFSFNHYLGEVTAEKGYEESIIIWGNTTRADVGGGLCQVSSTAFRAAFWAGLPIIERWAHAFRVSYYEPPIGLDATIYSPDVDLKWVNDTGHYILIQTYVDEENSTLTFDYYGTNPGRTVEMEGPYEENPVEHGPAVYRDDPTLPKGETKQIEWAKDGLDVTIYRIIKENGVEVEREAIFSQYRPWQAVFLVGTKETP